MEDFILRLFLPEKLAGYIIGKAFVNVLGKVAQQTADRIVRKVLSKDTRGEIKRIPQKVALQTLTPISLVKSV